MKLFSAYIHQDEVRFFEGQQAKTCTKTGETKLEAVKGLEERVDRSLEIADEDEEEAKRLLAGARRRRKHATDQKKIIETWINKNT